jgi:hypothetical protein
MIYMSDVERDHMFLVQQYHYYIHCSLGVSTFPDIEISVALSSSTL